MEQHIVIFSMLIALGFALVVLGFRFSDKTRKVIDTTGAIIFHVGIFGILYHKVALHLFLSLVFLVISLFILIDPLKISQLLNTKIYRLFGYLILLLSVTFSLDHFTGFPVWLWAIPVVIYLAPYLILPLKKHHGMVIAFAWLVVILYAGFIGYTIYGRFHFHAEVPYLSKILSKMQTPRPDSEAEKNTVLKYQPLEINPETMQDPNTQPAKQKPQTKKNQEFTSLKPLQQKNDKPSPSFPGPYVDSLKQADQKYLDLNEEYQSLKKKYDMLKKQNKDLKEQVEELKAARTETL